MTWAKLDDRFHDNRKVRRVWRRCPQALGLHVMAITYCAAHLTDGIVDADFVHDRVPVVRSRDRMTSTLVEAGLWRVVKDGWEINDFTKYNGTRASIEERRRLRQEAGKAGASARWGDGNSMANRMAPAIANATDLPCTPDGTCHDHEMPPSRPVPTPTPVEAKASTSRPVSPEVVRLCERLAARIAANDPKASVAPQSQRWQTDMRLLVADRDGNVAEVERVIDWCQDDSFWRSNILSPGKLRKQFTQLLLRAAQGSNNNVTPIRSSVSELHRKLIESEQSA